MSKKRRSNQLDLRKITVNPLIPVSEITFDDAVRIFLQDAELRNLSVHSISWYRDKLSVFSKLLDRDNVTTPEEVTKKHIKSFIVEYQRKNRSDSTINGILRALRAFFNFLYKENLITNDLGSKIKLIKEEEKIVPTFTKQQIRKLFKQPDLSTFTGLRDLTIMLLFLDTGIRVRELCDIKIQDINWREKQILIKGKGNKQRLVPVQVTTVKQLRKYAHIRGELITDYFFVTLDNTPIKKRQVQDRIRGYGIQAKITDVRVSPHTFRHTFAKMYIQNGGDIFTLQKILGHTSLEMVRRYVNMFSGEVQDAHRKFSPVESLR